MNGKIETSLGTIIFDNSVIAKIAAVITADCYGVVGMAFRSKGDGFASLLKGNAATKGVKVNVTANNELLIELHVVSQYGVNVTAVSESIISNVSYQVKALTGFDVKDVTVFVESVRTAGV